MRLCVFAFVCLVTAWSQTATVTGTLKTGGAAGVPSNAFLRFELKGGGGNQCRYNGNAVIDMTKPFDLAVNSSGVVSGTIYRNDSITCGSSTSSNVWRTTWWRNGQAGPPCDVRITSGSFDATQPACLNVSPVAAVPTTDGTYARLDGTNQPFTGAVNVPTLEGIQYADANTSIQTAMNKCLSAGCRVKVSILGSPYTITSALNPPFSGVTLECDNAGISNFGTIGTVIRTSGAIWAFQNPTPTANVLNHLDISNCVFDLSGNSSALGGLNLRSIGHSKFYNVSVILPVAGAMEGFRFDAQDVAFGGFWNECFGCIVLSSGTGLTNTHSAFRWINGANNNNLFGGEINGVNTAFKLESADHVTILGTSAETTSNCVSITGGNNVTSGNIQPGRCESALAGAQAVSISAGSFNNHVVVTPVGYADAAHELSDLSLGKNEIQLNSAGGFGSFYTWGSQFNLGKFGFNMTGTQVGIEVAGLLASTRATGNAADFKGTSGTQAFFCGAFDTYGSARCGTSSNDPLAFFTNNIERGRFAPGGAFSLTTSLGFTNLLASATAPTVSSGFGSSPSIPTNNGTAAFTINVGTGGTATNGVIALPTAANGWVCKADDLTTQSATVFVTRQIASSTTTATIANFNTAGAQAAWVASDIISASCLAR